MKKLSLSVLLLCLFSFFSLQAPARSVAEAPADALLTWRFDNQYAAILDAEPGTNQEGEDCILFTFEWAHTNETPQSFLSAFTMHAYQEDVELLPASINSLQDDILTADVEKDIPCEATIAFVLLDTSSDITLSLIEAGTNDNDPPVYTLHPSAEGIISLLNIAEEEIITEPAAEEETVVVSMVWIPQSGSRYHSKSSCSNMIDPSEVALEDAEDLGFTPCKRCY